MNVELLYWISFEQITIQLYGLRHCNVCMKSISAVSVSFLLAYLCAAVACEAPRDQ